MEPWLRSVRSARTSKSVMVHDRTGLANDRGWAVACTALGYLGRSGLRWYADATCKGMVLGTLKRWDPGHPSPFFPSGFSSFMATVRAAAVVRHSCNGGKIRHRSSV